MKKVFLFSQVCLLIFIVISSNSCNGQNQTQNNHSIEKKPENKREIIEYGEHDNIKAGLLDKAGNLWFGTTNEGVYRFDGKTFEHFTDQDGLSSNYINCIVQDKKGILWFGTNDGLSKYDGNSFTQVTVPWPQENTNENEWWDSNIIQSMLVDRQGDLWLGTGGHGVFRYDGETFTQHVFTNDYPQSDGLHHNYIQSMIEDSEGNIWLTSMTHGNVTCYDGSDFIHYSSDDGLLDDMVYASFQDENEKIWFGTIQTKHYGLYRLDGKSFTGFGKDDGLCDNFVTGFFEDKNGLLWIRTGSVVCTYDGKTFSPFLTEDGEELKGIGFIVEDKDQNIWLGGRYGRLWKYDYNKFTDFTQKGR